MRNIFSKSYAKNVVKKLVSDSILSQNLAYLYINSPKFYTIYFYCTIKSGATKIYQN